MGMPIDEPQTRGLVRLRDAARYLGVGVSTLYRLIDRGGLTPVVLPGLRGMRFDRSELAKLVEGAKVQGRTRGKHRAACSQSISGEEKPTV